MTLEEHLRSRLVEEGYPTSRGGKRVAGIQSFIAIENASGDLILQMTGLEALSGDWQHEPATFMVKGDQVVDLHPVMEGCLERGREALARRVPIDALNPDARDLNGVTLFEGLEALEAHERSEGRICNANLICRAYATLLKLHFAAAKAAPASQALECEGCGSREDIEAIRARGHLSCCPERKMTPAATAIDWRGTMRSPAAPPAIDEQVLVLGRYMRGPVEVLTGAWTGTEWVCLTEQGMHPFDVVGWWPLPPIDLVTPAT